MSKLSPENLFVPSQKSVSSILARYNLPLTRFEQATSGIENLTLLVWCEGRKYVLRVYPQEKKSDADILLELDFMAHLRENGLPLPAVISSLDDRLLVVCELDGKKWQCVLMEYAHGAQPLAYTPALLDHMATLQARMHTLGEQYVRTRNLDVFIARGRNALRGTWLTDGLLRNAALDSSLRDFLRYVNTFVVELHDTLPRGLSHFDFAIDNVFTNHDRVTAILDFGDIEYMPVVVCLGFTLWDVLFEPGGEPALVTRYLQKYQEVRQLNQKEKEVLLQTILFRHYVITTVQIHFGDFSQSDFDKALQQERNLKSLELQF